MRSLALLFALYLFAPAPATSVVPATKLAFVDYSGDYGWIDVDSHVQRVTGSIGAPECNALAQDGDGRLVASVSTPPSVLALDPRTGRGAFLRHIFVNGVTGLSYSPEGWLYASTPDALYFLDFTRPPPDATPILIGNFYTLGGPVHGVRDLAFAPDGTLYAWSDSAGLVRVDRRIAQCTDVDPFDLGSSAIQSLVFADDGRLFGAGDGLYELDPATGAVTTLESALPVQVRGLGWLPFSHWGTTHGPP